MDLKELRDQIDILDGEMLEMFQKRMKLCLQVAEYKKKNNVAILQTGRWDDVMETMRHEAALHDLDPEFIAKVFNAIHEASVKEQNQILVK